MSFIDKDVHLEKVVAGDVVTVNGNKRVVIFHGSKGKWLLVNPTTWTVVEENIHELPRNCFEGKMSILEEEL